MGACLFCTGKTELTEEHIFAKWSAKILNVEFPIKIMINGTKPFEGSKTRKALKVSTYQVCKSCNNGWLAELERNSKPLLHNIILGETKMVPEYFDSSDQITIAVWATKTMLLLDYASSFEHGYRTKLFTQKQLQLMMQKLFSTKAPLEDTTVWISATKTRNPEDPKGFVFSHFILLQSFRMVHIYQHLLWRASLFKFYLKHHKALNI